MDLENFGQFIKHTYWESFESELQLEKVRKGESFHLIKSLFESCDLLTEEIEEKLTPRTYIELYKGEFEMDLKMRWTKKRFFFSIAGGP